MGYEPDAFRERIRESLARARENHLDAQPGYSGGQGKSLARAREDHPGMVSNSTMVKKIPRSGA
jgi:hypothetical protein